MISKYKDTYDCGTLGSLLSMMKPDKPVYAKCAYNYYKLKRIVDMGDFYMLETPEEEGVIALDRDE